MSGTKPTIDELINLYCDVYDDDLRAKAKKEGMSWQDCYALRNQLRDQLHGETLAPMIRDALAQLPLGASFLEDLKEHIEAAEEEEAERLARAKAAGFDSHKEMREAERAARRSKAAKKAAATRAQNRFDDAKRVLEGRPAFYTEGMTIEQARKIVDAQMASLFEVVN